MKDVNKMSRKELIALISNLINEREHEFKFNPINKVRVADVLVTSNVENLDRCMQVVNELVKKNKTFITLRKNKIKMENLGFYD